MKYYWCLFSFSVIFSVNAQDIVKSTVIGSPTDTEIAINLVADDAGNTYVGGSMNDKALIVKQNALHQTLWSKTLTFPPATDNKVSIAFLDILGDTIFGCGYIEQFSLLSGTFYFKINAQTGTIYWSKYEITSKGYLSAMRYANGKYFIVGGTEQSNSNTLGKVMAVSSQTGSIIWQTPLLNYTFPGAGPTNRTYFTSATEMQNGKMFITGVHKTYMGTVFFPYMPVLIGINESGSVFLERRVPLPFVGSSTSYNGTRIEYDANGNVVLVCVNNGSGSAAHYPGLVLMKLDNLGNTIFSKEYEIDGQGLTFAHGINETSESYVLCGPVYTNFTGLFSLKVNKNGELQKCIGISKPNIFYGGSAYNSYGNCNFKNGIHYFPATETSFPASESNINKIILDEDLNTIGDCSELTELQVLTTDLNTQPEPLEGISTANTFIYQDGIIEENQPIYIQCDSISLNLEYVAGCQSLVTANVEGFQTPVFHWSDGTISSSNSLLTPITGTLIVSVLDVQCCQLTDTIVIEPASDMSVNLPADTSFCLQSGIAFTLTPIVNNPNAPVSYSWNNLSTAPSLPITVSGTYWVDVSDSCATFRDSILITILELPEIEGLADTAVCTGDFPVTIVPTPTPGASLLWDNGVSTSTRTVTAPGEITLQATNACGTTSVTVNVTQTDLPDVTLVAAIDTCLHEGASIVLIPALENVTLITWSNGTSGNTISVSQTGTYTIYGSNTCGSDTASCTVWVREFPYLNLPAMLDTCFETGTGFAYTATGSSGSYQWESGSQNATEWISQEGIYICALTNQCGTITDSMAVRRLADLEVYIPEDSLRICEQQIPINLLRIETNYDYQLFSPWTGTLTESALNESGWYLIRAFNACGEIWDSIYVDLQNEQTLYMPNSFTPNGDGINDRLELTGVNVTLSNILIFNRWGEQVFYLKADDINPQTQESTWDGSYKDQPCPDGIYLVQVMYINCFGTPAQFNGHINLLR